MTCRNSFSVTTSFGGWMMYSRSAILSLAVVCGEREMCSLMTSSSPPVTREWRYDAVRYMADARMLGWDELEISWAMPFWFFTTALRRSDPVMAIVAVGSSPVSFLMYGSRSTVDVTPSTSVTAAPCIAHAAMPTYVPSGPETMVDRAFLCFPCGAFVFTGIFVFI